MRVFLGFFVTGALTWASAVSASPAPAEEILGQLESLFVVKLPPVEPGDPYMLRIELRGTTPKVLLDSPVRSVSAVRLFDLVPGGAPEVVIAWERPGTPAEVVVLTQSVAGELKPLLSLEGRGFEIEDATGDGRPDLVIQATQGRALAQVPVVHHLREGMLVATKVGTTSFYARHEKSLRTRIDAPIPDEPVPSYTNDRLVDLLDLGLLQEFLSRKPEAFRTYQALLARAAVPTRLTREVAAERGASVELAREARRAMARIAGLRFIGEPRPVASTSPAPSPTPSPR